MKTNKLVRWIFRERKKRPVTMAPADDEKKKSNPDVSPVESITIHTVEAFWGQRDR